MACPIFRDLPGLSVSCSDTTVFLNSTGLPDHKFLNPQGLIVDQEFMLDFPLYPELNETKDYQDPCNFTTIFHLDNKPSEDKYMSIAGFALNGVPFFSPLSVDWVDPFYPPPGYEPENLDGCVAHTQVTGIYHYHMMPPCLFGDDENGETPLVKVGDAKTVALDGFDPEDGLVTMGWAFDGFPVYGPYDDEGRFHTDLDNCNGKKDETGNYGYYSTLEFPYHIGCFGPGVMDGPPNKCSQEE